jgi:hypothetical protein
LRLCRHRGAITSSACAIALSSSAASPPPCVRSELVALAVDDLTFEPESVRLRLRRSKTNQEGEEEVVSVLYGSDPVTCPVRTLQA